MRLLSGNPVAVSNRWEVVRDSFQLCHYGAPMPSVRRVALCMEYPITQWGGVEVLVKELVAGLASDFNLCLVSRDAPESLEASGFSRHVIAHFPWDSEAPYRLQAGRLAEWLRDERVDLVHFHLGGTYAFRTRSWSQSPIPIVARTGIPCIATNHGAFSLFDFCAPRRSTAFRLLMLPLAWAGRARTLAALRSEITVSDNDCANMRRWYPPFKSRFQRIYHSQLTGDEPASAARDNTIFCLGTIGPRKGQTFLVRAFALIAERFPDWTLHIAGRKDAGSREVEEIERIIAAHGLRDRIRLLGAISPDEAAERLRTCGVFAMPSLAEGLGLSLQEALVLGAPAVASNVGGIRDMIIPGQTGLLARAGSPEELASAMALLLGSESLREALGRAARERILALRMNRSAMLEEHRKLYTSILQPDALSCVNH
ncbi:MAG: glycosyltransferase family 4 protein [Terrimicrobiaceae bacterium]|nr:glycosyltransferase family 4 protein [Terrimicrobiaceae bacterium]